MSAELSAIAVGDTAESLTPLLRALDLQTAKDRLELVVVAPAGEHGAIERVAPGGLAGVRLVAEPRIGSMPTARLVGIRAAGAPAVAFTETHAFPEARWAEALIERHREDWVAVGPALVNGNPKRARSWANILLDYGRFYAYPGRRDPEPCDDLPGHNSSYKRDALLELGDDLVPLMLVESALHAELCRRGGRLVLEPRARTRHVNVTRPWSVVRERWYSGRLYASARSLHWPARRRLAYAGAWPLIAAVRLPRALRDAERLGGRRLAARLTVPFALGLAVQSAAEAAGYLWGHGDSARGVVNIELHRFDHLARGDRPAALPEELRSPA
jgi:hypothetical protein